jgi:hypothetical protein
MPALPQAFCVLKIHAGFAHIEFDKNRNAGSRAINPALFG